MKNKKLRFSHIIIGIILVISIIYYNVEKKENENITVVTATELPLPVITETYDKTVKPVEQYIFTINQVFNGMYDNNVNTYENDNSIVVEVEMELKNRDIQMIEHLLNVFVEYPIYNDVDFFIVELKTKKENILLEINNKPTDENEDQVNIKLDL